MDVPEQLPLDDHWPVVKMWPGDDPNALPSEDDMTEEELDEELYRIDMGDEPLEHMRDGDSAGYWSLFEEDWRAVRGGRTIHDIKKLITCLYSVDELDERPEHSRWWDFNDGAPNATACWLFLLQEREWAVVVGDRFWCDSRQQQRSPSLHVARNPHEAIDAATDLTEDERECLHDAVSGFPRRTSRPSTS